MVKVWVELYIAGQDVPNTAPYELPGVPRKGEQFEVHKFNVVGTVQTVRWTADEDHDVVLVIHA